MHPLDDPTDQTKVSTPMDDSPAAAGGGTGEGAEHVNDLGEPRETDPSGAPAPSSEPGPIQGVRDQQTKPPSRRTIGDSVMTQGQNGQGSQGRI